MEEERDRAERQDSLSLYRLVVYGRKHPRQAERTAELRWRNTAVREGVHGEAAELDWIHCSQVEGGGADEGVEDHGLGTARHESFCFLVLLYHQSVDFDFCLSAELCDCIRFRAFDYLISTSEIRRDCIPAFLDRGELHRSPFQACSLDSDLALDWAEHEICFSLWR